MFGINLIKLQRILLRITFFLVPTQFALHLWPKWSYVLGLRVDYFSPKLYLVDVFIILYLITCLISSHEKIQFKNKYFLIFLTLLFVNLVFTKLFENTFLYQVRILLYIIFLQFSLKRLNLYEDFIKPLSIATVVVSILAVVQFIKQGSTGWFFYFLGERIMSITTIGAPLVNLFGSNYLRSPSTFSHPNSLAGFLVVFLILINEFKFLQSGIALKKLVNVLGIPALVLTFSKSGILALVGYLFYKFFFGNTKLTKRAYFLFFIGSLLFTLILFISSSNLIKRGALFSESINTRIILTSRSKEIIYKNFWFGVGANNFILELSKKPPVIKSVLFLQPVHNIYLLVFSEWGVVGLIFFVVMVIKIFRKAVPVTSLAISVVLFTGLFDHYWLTLNQNLLLLLILITLGISKRKLFKDTIAVAKD